MRVRLGVLFAIAAGLFSPRPTLAAQLDSAVAQLEREVVALERQPVEARPPEVPTLLAGLAHRVIIAERAAADQLAAVLPALPALPAERRAELAWCIDRHLLAARHDLVRASDPSVRDEYRVTCVQLLALRQRIAPS